MFRKKETSFHRRKHHTAKKFHRHNLIFHAKKFHHVFSNLNFRVQLFHLLSLAKYSRVMFRREKRKGVTIHWNEIHEASYSLPQQP